MKIAFATIYDLNNPLKGSGLYYEMAQELIRQGHVVYPVGPLTIQEPWTTRFFRRISASLLKKKYRTYQDPFTGLRLGQAVDAKLRGLDYDILLTNDYCIAGYTRTSKPVVLYTDSLFPKKYSENVNPRLNDLSPISVGFCQHTTQQGINRADMLVFPAEWAIRDAKEKWGVQKKVVMIPFGANIEAPPLSITQRRAQLDLSQKKPLQMLFIGKDWHRKGGQTAIEVTSLLNQRGIDAHLHVVGAFPPNPAVSDVIHLHGYLNKMIPQEQELLRALFENSDIFLLPSVAEGFGIAYVEAAAYGIPSLGFKTVGVTTAVQDGKSGVLLELGSSPSKFADVVQSWVEDPQQYRVLAKGARQYYEQSANWQVSVTRLVAEIKDSI